MVQLFARLTHSHPGRIVWLLFNVFIAIVLMEMGISHAVERILGLYSNIALAWIGAVVADLIICKPLGLSPKGIEFRRAYLYDINPVGVGALLIASVLSMLSYLGFFGLMAKGLASFIALGSAVLCVPIIAYLTKGKYYIARQPEKFRRLRLLTAWYVNGTMSLPIWRVAQPITVRFALYAVHLKHAVTIYVNPMHVGQYSSKKPFGTIYQNVGLVV